jgi:signal transduction histidine kinase
MGAELKSMPEIGLAGGSVSAEVLSIVSHDLKSPLATITMAASLLDDESRSQAEKAQMLNMVKRATARMDRLIRDILEVARIDAGRSLPIEARCADVGPCVKEVCEAHAFLAQGAGVRLVCDVEPGLPPARADCDRIAQVLANLIGNALKFTPAGGEVSVEAQAEEDAIMIAVSDSGPGMSSDELDRVFDPYWQAQRTASLGSGLGLKIAKAIVDAHGGSIQVESAPGQGTTFRFRLPRA